MVEGRPEAAPPTAARVVDDTGGCVDSVVEAAPVVSVAELAVVEPPLLTVVDEGSSLSQMAE